MSRYYWSYAPVFSADPINGLDTNDGLAAPFKTLQGAFKNIVGNHDFGGHNPTLQLVAAAVYSTGTPYNSILLTAAGHLVGAELLLLSGDPASPPKLYADSWCAAIYVRDQFILQMDGLSFLTTGNHSKAVHNDGQGAVVDVSNCRFGEFPLGQHMVADTGGFLNVSGTNYINGGAYSHITAGSAAQVSHGGSCVIAAGLQFADSNGARAPLLSVSDGARYYGGAVFSGPGAGGATYGKQYAISGASAQMSGTVWPGDQAGTIS